jgi:hypothetical protein
MRSSYGSNLHAGAGTLVGNAKSFPQAGITLPICASEPCQQASYAQLQSHEKKKKILLRGISIFNFFSMYHEL